jgi:hypothetical protein
MNREHSIPVLHQAIAAAAVKAVLGHRAVIREMVEAPGGPSAAKRAGALKYGIRTFWRRWTARQSNGSSTTNETPD